MDTVREYRSCVGPGLMRSVAGLATIDAKPVVEPDGRCGMALTAAATWCGHDLARRDRSPKPRTIGICISVNRLQGVLALPVLGELPPVVRGIVRYCLIKVDLAGDIAPPGLRKPSSRSEESAVLLNVAIDSWQ